MEARSEVPNVTGGASDNAEKPDETKDIAQPMNVAVAEPVHAELTDAQKNDMRAMARALHDKLNKLQRETGQEAETVRNIPSALPRSGSLNIARGQNVMAPSDSSRTTGGVETPATPIPNVQLRPTQRSAHKPPILLDTAICILLVLLFAIICRRMV